MVEEEEEIANIEMSAPVEEQLDSSWKLGQKRLNNEFVGLGNCAVERRFVVEI